MIEGTKTIAGKVIPDHYITEPNKLLNAARTLAILNPGTITLNPSCDVSEHKIRNQVPCKAILNLANQAYWMNKIVVLGISQVQINLLNNEWNKLYLNFNQKT